MRSHWTMGDFGSVQSQESSISEFSKKISELFNVQKKVDDGLSRMPSGPAKDRLLKLREESRGIFSKYIMPAYNAIKNYISSDKQTLGVLPLLPFAAAAAATAALGYVGKSIYTEQKILNDPSFTAAQKTALLSSSGLSSITQAVSSVRNLLIVAGIGFVAYQIWKAKKTVGGN